MRYSDTHKEETRKKVVKAAARAVRAKGPEGVSVAEVMAEAGLTHGGFYAHFPNKKALVVSALEEAFGQSARRFARMTDGQAPAEALATFVDLYVTPEHRANPEGGCPVAGLSSELPRQGLPVREAYERGVRSLVARIANWLPADTAERESLAASIVAEMAGTVALSRAISDDDEAAQLLAAARGRIKTRMGIVQ
ncbi:MAG: TetR/AcrR family transcriptional regulator [Alphaproteobacteria bacterium]|nr:TetR/AcrR family transcriptional regulator [Alphaproteobacteria bacterium]MBU1516930.1 TetR/AcrR family transcriptional regulator [Alphaproteobacteria bacterium]MBU2095818.1 TetR/AcrR family transcriptional regulator [Alphaproteobacteria bacterium]MBU2152045.1 TetR/AcrR family transcriptional regulator [Alphaproteobacteria bacterium]MBU2309566.1 TetR/AcrR family transcriptional regulator [Alphaproteobacteria bacterium]